MNESKKSLRADKSNTKSFFFCLRWHTKLQVIRNKLFCRSQINCEAQFLIFISNRKPLHKHSSQKQALVAKFFLKLASKQTKKLYGIFWYFLGFSCRINFFLACDVEKYSGDIEIKFDGAHACTHTLALSAEESRSVNKILCCCTINFHFNDIVGPFESVYNWKIMENWRNFNDERGKKNLKVRRCPVVM